MCLRVEEEKVNSSVGQLHYFWYMEVVRHHQQSVWADRLGVVVLLVAVIVIVFVNVIVVKVVTMKLVELMMQEE